MIIAVTYAMWKSITTTIAGGPLVPYLITSGAVSQACSATGGFGTSNEAIVFQTAPLDPTDLADFNLNFSSAAQITSVDNLLAAQITGVAVK